MAPPYYPSVNNVKLGEKAAKANQILIDACQYTKDELGDDCWVKNIYNGISDLSYSMFIDSDDVITYIEENMLMWKSVYTIPLDLIKELTTPVMNLGPWAKDIHKYTERVYTPDLYYKTPYVTNYVVRRMFGE